MHPAHDDVLRIYSKLATGRYGLQQVNQLEHALQCAQAAERAGDTPALILAALLHDVGHMIHHLGDHPAAAGVDDHHEALGAKWLRKRFPREVSEPVALHVAAKRYLCGAEPDYFASLSPDSVESLALQGGPMAHDERDAFLAQPFSDAAIRLRRYDEAAKVRGAETPPLSHYLSYLARFGTNPEPNLLRDGFVVLRDFWDTSAQTYLRETADAFGIRAATILRKTTAEGRSLSDIAKTSDDLVVVAEADNSSKVCRFEYLMGADAKFANFVRTRITPTISKLGAEPYLPFKDKENEKLPGGGAFRPHQDFAAYQAFGPRFNLTAMVTIDAQTRANGCLAFATNFHSVAANPETVTERFEGRPLFKHYQDGPQNGDVREDIVARLQWEWVETSPADLVIFDSFVPHKSETNTTQSPRRAMFLTHSRAREGDWYARYYADKRAHYDAAHFHVSTPTARG